MKSSSEKGFISRNIRKHTLELNETEVIFKNGSEELSKIQPQVKHAQEYLNKKCDVCDKTFPTRYKKFLHSKKHDKSKISKELVEATK